MPTPWEVIADVSHGLREGITGAVQDVTQAVDGAVRDIWNNTIGRADDIIIDLWGAVTGLPKTLLDGLMYMFRDPKFWMGLFAFYGLSALGAGLAAAQEAPLGYKMVAFREYAGMAWGKLGAGFLTKAHKLSYLLSPTYRESFSTVMSNASDQLFEAGVDLMQFTQLVGDIGGLVLSFRALTGEDAITAKDHWSTILSDVGAQGAALFTQWGADPDAMIDWWDENILYEEHNRAAAFMRNLSEGLERVERGSAEFLGRIQNVTGALKKVGAGVDNVFGTNYSERLAEDLSVLDEVLLTPWVEMNKTLRETSGALEVNILQLSNAPSENAFSVGIGTDLSRKKHSEQNTALLEYLDTKERGT